MSGTKLGGMKAAATNKQRHGDGFYAMIGAKGGRNGHTGGFAAMPYWKVAAAGRKGGSISRRGKAKKWNTKKVIRNGQEVTLIDVKYIPSC